MIFYKRLSCYFVNVTYISALGSAPSAIQVIIIATRIWSSHSLLIGYSLSTICGLLAKFVRGKAIERPEICKVRLMFCWDTTSECRTNRSVAAKTFVNICQIPLYMDFDTSAIRTSAYSNGLRCCDILLIINIY